MPTPIPPKAVIERSVVELKKLYEQIDVEVGGKLGTTDGKVTDDEIKAFIDGQRKRELEVREAKRDREVAEQVRRAKQKATQEFEKKKREYEKKKRDFERRQLTLM